MINALVVEGSFPVALLSGQRGELTMRLGTRMLVDPTDPQRVVVEIAGLACTADVGRLRPNGVVHVLSQLVLPQG